MTAWTDAMRAVVRAHHGRMSAAEIGRLLGKTRNSVIGCSHRLRLPRLPRGGGKPGRAPKRPVVSLSPPHKSPVASIAPLSMRVSFIELNQFQCRSMDASGVASTYCGHAVFQKSSYCQYHAAKYGGWMYR